ncbi:DUF305 domain-containing protein [Nocardiopsis metallicus]|uniref:Uncharacterized protein (DUF305 family) n=1 Tax=Nocardiopsis metallicus TaxID=179819 RepID=A0A840WC49_9ACTN|nr:DUF305 domain-containing protein [Nocardiopsis metallicus]MBB5494569.1 uncharacterized protein (DUF305 family) [Nocardiopsis metallicus]
MMTLLKKALMLVAAAFAATVFLAACGGAEEDSAPPASETSEQGDSEFNDADVMFAQMMIPHHEQATAMAELAQGRAGDEVQALAEDIKAEQGPEIEQMNALLEAWGHEPMEDMEGMDHDGMAGMMSEEQMAELETAEGGEFDTMFLEMMIEHHEGAIDMAQTQMVEGTNPEARALAQDIIDAQRAEIELMNEMLGSGAGDQEGDDDESPSEEGHDGH